MMSSLWQFSILGAIFLSSLISCEAEAQFDNVRCKCICPAEPDKDRSLDIQVVTVSIPEECSCESVMHRNESDCLRCECKYESRNIMTMEVVIFLIIGVIGCLILYLIILFVLDPSVFRSKLSVRPEEGFVIIPDQPDTQQASSYLGRVGNAQRRWRSQVQQQRENIFDRHTILS